jgi:IclR family pca regulon transcriptional regulator
VTTGNSRRPDITERPDGIQSVRRALMILELFSDRRPALSMSEIAELTGLNRATSYRFCQTLLSLGYSRRGRAVTAGAEGSQPGLSGTE